MRCWARARRGGAGGLESLAQAACSHRAELGAVRVPFALQLECGLLQLALELRLFPAGDHPQYPPKLKIGNTSVKFSSPYSEEYLLEKCFAKSERTLRKDCRMSVPSKPCL